MNWALRVDLTTIELIIAIIVWSAYSFVALRRGSYRRALLATLLIWFFIAPKIAYKTSTRVPTSIVLDDSISMTRAVDDVSAFQRALESANELAQEARKRGSEPRVVPLSNLDVALKPNALDSFIPSAEKTSFANLDALPGKVVLISDGVENESFETTNAPKENNPLHVSTDAIVVGFSDPAIDWRWENAPATQTIFPQDQAQIQGELRLDGANEPRTAIVRLWDAEGKTLLWSEQTTVENARSDFNFSWDPPRDKKSEYRLEVVDAKDDVPEGAFAKEFLNERNKIEFSRRNNVATFAILPREKKLKVLLIDDLPTYEYRYARAILSRCDEIELNVLLLSADPRAAEQDELNFPLERFERRALAKFDAIIVGNVPEDKWQDKFSKIADVVLKEGSRTSLWMRSTDIPDRKLYPGKKNEKNVPLTERFKLVAAPEGKRLYNELVEPLESIELTQFVPAFAPDDESILLLNVKNDANQTFPAFFAKAFERNKIAWQGVDEFWRLQSLDDKSTYRRFLLDSLHYLTSSASGETIANPYSDPTDNEKDDYYRTREDEDVAAKIERVKATLEPIKGRILDLRDKNRVDAKKELERFADALFENLPQTETERVVDLAPKNILLPAILAIFFFAWLPRRIGRAPIDSAFPPAA